MGGIKPLRMFHQVKDADNRLFFSIRNPAKMLLHTPDLKKGLVIVLTFEF